MSVWGVDEFEFILYTMQVFGHGEVAELVESGTLLMCCSGKTGPRVRIPPSPPWKGARAV